MTLPGQGPNGSSGSLSTAALVGAVATVAIMVAAITVLTVMGKPVDNLFLILGSLVLPTLGTVLATRRLDAQNTTLTQVATHVNGKMDNLITDKANLEDQVRSLGATPVSVQIPSPRSDAAPLPTADATAVPDAASTPDDGGKHSG